MSHDGSVIATIHSAGSNDDSALHFITERELTDLRAIRDAAVTHVNSHKHGSEAFSQSFHQLYDVLKEKYG